MEILGVKIDKLNKTEVLEKVSEFLHSNQSHKIFTPNPEMLVDAQKDEYFKNILNSGDLNVCDGFGIQLLSRVSPNDDEGSLVRISGVDLMMNICEVAEKTNKSIYLLGSGSDEVIKKTAEELIKRFPKLKICGVSKGCQIVKLSNCQIDYDKEENNELVADMVMASPDILFVAFGHGKQEKWIHENLKDLPSVKIAMGVGGSFDYISGKVKRAPLFIRKIGLEWMYRLITQPWRIGRIWKATITFMFLVLKDRYTD